jgi:hypothetical protein
MVLCCSICMAIVSSRLKPLLHNDCPFPSILYLALRLWERLYRGFAMLVLRGFQSTSGSTMILGMPPNSVRTITRRPQR